MMPRLNAVSQIKESMNGKKLFDVIIVGGSYAGLAAGMTLGRALRNVLIIDSGNPCNKQTPYSHNFITHDGKPPGEIARLAREQVLQYPSVSLLHATVTEGIKTEDIFTIQVDTGESFTSKKLVFATGIKDIMPDIPGFAACWGISALHCPYCHGYEVRHQTTGVLANGDAGYELSSLISNWTPDLTLYTNGKSTLTEQQRMKLDVHRIPVVEKDIARLEHQNGHIENILFSDETKASVNAIYSRPAFVQGSPVPQSLGCEITPEGYLKTDVSQRTTIHGVFACGDNATRIRTVASATAMGTTTGIMVNKELIEEAF
jgi:thioredoxin reductase